uniref:LY6/PLAUR domain containing 6 n=1 Tax=Equus asinus TaxID=9793 RepID=A0A9L0JGM3_EQUAS
MQRERHACHLNRFSCLKLRVDLSYHTNNLSSETQRHELIHRIAPFLVKHCWSSKRETRYCYTQHTMEVTGNSISVTKRCVPLEDCLSTGCRDSEREGHKVCTSCCEGNICNLPLPRNETDATFATTSPINQTNGHPHCMSVIVSCLWVWLGLTL